MPPSTRTRTTTSWPSASCSTTPTPRTAPWPCCRGATGGPVYEHYDGEQFVGSMQPHDVAGLELGQARLLALPAGSIHIHHYRLVHGSAPNLSARPRRLLINAYRAADAIPFTTDSNRSSLYGRLVRGQEARVARRQAGDIRMPPDFSRGYTSIYELQTRPR